MATIYGKNYGKPSLDLNFAGNKSLIDTTTGTNYVTFSRAQSGNEATYVGSDGLIKYASADEPRFDHDPETLESLGLLVEELRTNLIIDSEEFAAPISTWTRSGTSVTSNTTIAPDGTLTADTVSNTPSQSSWIRPSLSLNTSLTYTITLYVKPLTTNKIISFEWQGANTFDLSNPGPGVQTLPNGWYRLTVTKTGVNAGPAIYIGAYGTTSDSVSFAFWGAQLETGSFPTSYIPTSGSTVTRAADEASITGTNFSSWYNQNEGTLLTTADYNGNNPGPNNYNMIVEGYSGLSARDFSCNIGASNPNFTTRYSFTNLDLIPVGGPIPTKTAFKLVGSYSADGSAAVFNGGLVKTTGATTSVLTPADAMSIGRRVGSSLFLNGHISRLTYYPKRLPDIELQQLTK